MQGRHTARQPAMVEHYCSVLGMRSALQPGLVGIDCIKRRQIVLCAACGLWHVMHAGRALCTAVRPGMAARLGKAVRQASAWPLKWAALRLPTRHTSPSAASKPGAPRTQLTLACHELRLACTGLPRRPQALMRACTEHCGTANDMRNGSLAASKPRGEASMH